jgi:RimJ/RimL family protein N-acetyltransferase
MFYPLIVIVLVILVAMLLKRPAKIGGHSSVEVRPLETLKPTEAAEWYRLFTPENVVGLGKDWSPAKAEETYRYSAQDAKASPRKYWHFAIFADGVPCGYIGVTPTKMEKYPQQLTIMVSVNYRGRGIAGKAIKSLARRKLGDVYAFVRLENEASNAAMAKVGKLVCRKDVFGSTHNIYLVLGTP